MYDKNVRSLVASLFARRCASTSHFLHATINMRPPSVTVLNHTFASNAVTLQCLPMPNARMSLCTQSVHYYPSPHPILVALHPHSKTRQGKARQFNSRQGKASFMKMIHFGNRPPLIRIRAPGYKSRLVHNVVSILSDRVLSRAWLYEILR